MFTLSNRLNKTNVSLFINDTFWTTLSSIIIAISGFLITYILANIFTQNEFGQFKFITTWLAIALGFGFTGFTYIIPQLLAKGHNLDLNQMFKKTFIRSSPPSLLLIALSLYYLYFQNYNLGIGFLFASFIIPFVSCGTLLNTFYWGKRDFKKLAITQNFVDILQVLSIIIVSIFSKNFILIIMAYFGITVIGNLIIFIYTKNKNQNPHTITEISHDSSAKKMNISNIILNFTTQLDKLLIFHFIGAVPLAIYSIVTSMSDQARVPTKILGTVLMPRLAKNNISLKSIYKIFFIITLMCLLMSFVLILIYPFVFQYFFPKYIDYIYLANWTTLLVIFAPVSFLYSSLQSQNNLKAMNNYTNLNSIMQIILFTISTLIGNVLYFIFSKTIIMLISIIFIFYALHKTNLK